MNKKKHNSFLFLIFLVFSVFLIILFLVNQNSATFGREPTETGSNTLNPGQPKSSREPQIFFCPEDSCKDIVVNLINNSKETIDCAIYDITSKEVSGALEEKQRQGTVIRIVTDKGRSQTKNSLVGVLKVSGINVLISPLESSYMHNKFCVFDDNISLVSSANFTNNSFSHSNNNIFVFENQILAKTLTEKIDSFYLGNFSKSSNILGKTIDENISIFFCPNNNCKTQILNQISSAKESIVCMMYSFTLDDFGDSLVRAKEKGTDIKVILESQQTSQYSEYEKLKAKGISVIEDNNSFLMHNKYCVFDGTVVTTGSMNFSQNGINNNDEILLVIRKQDISEKYKNNFFKYWNAWNLKTN